MAHIFRFLLAGVGVGSRCSAFVKTGCLAGSLFGGTKGQGGISLLLLCFLAIRSLPFHHRPIWKEMSNMMTVGVTRILRTARSRPWQRVRVDSSGHALKP